MHCHTQHIHIHSSFAIQIEKSISKKEGKKDLNI